MVDLSKWKQRAAAQKVEEALTKAKPDRTNEKLRRKFARGAQKALEAITGGARNPWLKIGNDNQIVVTAKLGRTVVPINGDPSTVWPPEQAEDYLRDLKAAAEEGQLDDDLLKLSRAEPTRQRRARKPKSS